MSDISYPTKKYVVSLNSAKRFKNAIHKDYVKIVQKILIDIVLNMTPKSIKGDSPSFKAIFKV